MQGQHEDERHLRMVYLMTTHMRACLGPLSLTKKRPGDSGVLSLRTHKHHKLKAWHIPGKCP